MEITVIQKMNKAVYNPAPHVYVDFQNIASILAYEQDLLSFFVMMNWLRLLKFLRIPPFTGPVVQSIMDTLQASRVIIFEFIILYTVIISSFTYHVAFGPDLNFYANYGQSFLSLFQVVFGNTDYTDLEASNKVFGPLLFLFFMLFVIFVLMNLLIGVLGEAYGDVQEVNSLRYNRYITRLMIETEEERIVPKGSEKHSKFVAFIISCCRRPVHDEEMKTVTSDDDEDANAAPKQTPIYNNDDELDDMVSEVLAEEVEAELEAEDKDENQKIMDRLEELEKMQKEMEEQYKKDFTDISKKLSSLIELVKTS